MNQSQKEFEAWFGEEKATIAGEYAEVFEQLFWHVWQASRAAQVIELPKPRELEFTSIVNPYTAEVSLHQGEFYDVYEIKQSLDAAGVKYK